MALTLDGNITASTEFISVSGTIPANAVPGFVFALDNEVLRLVRYRRPGSAYPYPANDHDWQVERGVDGSTKASHTGGATLYAVREAWAKGADVATVPGPFLIGDGSPFLPTAAQKAAFDAASPALDAEHPPLTAQAIDLSDTDATTAQFSAVDTRGGRSLALLTEVEPGTDSVNTLVISRVAGRPWCTIPAIETRTDAPGAIISEKTVWGNLGSRSPTTWLDLFPGLLPTSVIIVQPDQGGPEGRIANVNTAPLTDAAFTFTKAVGTPRLTSVRVTVRGDTTDLVATSATTADLVAALEALPSVGAWNVVVANGTEADTLDGTGWSIAFTGDLAGQDIATPTVDGLGLDETFSLSVNQAWTTGTATLTFRGQTTAALGPAPTLGQIIAALEALSTIGAGNVVADPNAAQPLDTVLDGDSAVTVYLAFAGDLGGIAVEMPTITDGSDSELSVSEGQAGGGNAPDVAEDTAGGAASGLPGLTLQAYAAGDWGNQITVELRDPGLPDQLLYVTSEDGWAFVVHLATDSEGGITTVASDLSVLFGGTGGEFAPWIVTAVSDVIDGAVVPTGALPLAGGTSGASGVTYSVKGSL